MSRLVQVGRGCRQQQQPPLVDMVSRPLFLHPHPAGPTPYAQAAQPSPGADKSSGESGRPPLFGTTEPVESVADKLSVKSDSPLCCGNVVFGLGMVGWYIHLLLSCTL